MINPPQTKRKADTRASIALPGSPKIRILKIKGGKYIHLLSKFCLLSISDDTNFRHNIRYFAKNVYPDTPQYTPSGTLRLTTQIGLKLALEISLPITKGAQKGSLGDSRAPGKIRAPIKIRT